MARGNIIQGQASGKLGDTVLMVRNGQQVQRVYTKAGARSGSQASEAARIQRVKFGSASNQWQLYRYVCTRMYRKGKKSTQSDYNYFVKRNATLLPYFTKEENASGVHVLMPGLMSEGNLGRIELVSFYSSVLAESQFNLRIYDSNVNFGTYLSWQGSLSNLKSILKKAYPNAAKVSYLFSYANKVTIEESGETFTSQMISHDVIPIELYKESQQGEDQQTLKQYFSSRISSSSLSSIIQNQSTGCIGGHNVFCLTATSADEATILGNIGVLVFATDDNVSDCYSTVLSEASVDPVKGVYALYSAYRTSESLRVAADSYGFQSGVMRDVVASVGNELSDRILAYAARLRTVDPEAADEYMKSIGNVEAVKAVQTRKVVDKNEDK